MTCKRQDQSARTRIAVNGDTMRHDYFFHKVVADSAPRAGRPEVQAASRPMGCAAQLSLMLAFVLLFALSCVLIGVALASP